MVVQYRVLVTSNEFVCVCLFTERCLLFSLLFLLAWMSSEEVEQAVDKLFSSEEEEDQKAPMTTTTRTKRTNKKNHSTGKGYGFIVVII